MERVKCDFCGELHEMRDTVATPAGQTCRKCFDKQAKISGTLTLRQLGY